MANILIHSAIPSLPTNTNSTSNLIVDTPTENSSTNNKYNGHVTRLRNVFIEHPLLSNKFNSDEYPLITNGHPTNFRQTKEMFQTLDNAPVVPPKPVVHNRQEHGHDMSRQSITTSSNRSLDTIPNHNNADVSYAIINRKYSNSEQHYDFPADAIEQLKKHQRDENDTTNHLSRSSNEQTITRVIPSFLPFNALKRMDHLNTVFVKPTKIDQSLPKLIFQDDEKQQPSKSIESPIFQETDYAQDDDRSSTPPLFYETPGIPEFVDDTPNDTRRVKFSTAPIRVYSTYSPSEYDRRNDAIDPFSAAAEYELEKRIERMNVFEVEVEKGPDGLGISVLGMGVGADSGLEKLGIFVKSLNPQGIIAKDGRIQVGDQIIEVNDQTLVGVTHSCATNILKTTSGLVKFVIGREKDPDKSEILLLIQRSLQLDRQREEMSQTFQQYHDAYYERNFNEDDNTTNTDEHMDEKLSNEFEIEILKQCYESLEKTLDNTEKEKEQYQQLYQKTQNDFKQIEEKYFQATVLIKELQDRETELRQLQTESNEKHEKRINELTKKIEELEKVIATSAATSEDKTSLPKATEFTTLPLSGIPERTSNRARSNSGQPFVSTSRNIFTASSVRIPSLSLEKILGRSQQDLEPWQIRSTPNTKSSDQFVQNSLMNKADVSKSCLRNASSKHVSTPSLGEISNDSNIITNRSYIAKVPSIEKQSNDRVSNDEYIEIKDWTPDQCIQWLTAQNLTSFIPIFLTRNIDGGKLLVLDGSKMKAMGIKSSKDRDQLKTKIKELKHIEMTRLRERILGQLSLSQRSVNTGKKSRSSSLTKLKERRFFGGSFGK